MQFSPAARSGARRFCGRAMALSAVLAIGTQAAQAAMAPSSTPATATAAVAAPQPVPKPVAAAFIAKPFIGKPSAADLSHLAPPLAYTVVTSPFGWRLNPYLKVHCQHKGVDYRAPAGTPIHAAQDGVITAIGRRHGDGLYIRIRHSGAVQTAYAHLSHFQHGLHRGSRVHCGDVIGLVGATGHATGPHLHYEVIVNGSQIDPLQIGKDASVQVAKLD